MPLGEVTANMNEYEVADALKLAPFSHPDTWHKRVAELRRQGREAEAELVEARFGDRMDDKARRDHERTTRALLRIFEGL